MRTSLAGLPDHLLIEKTLAGDTRAFDALIGRHIDTVRSLVRQMLRYSPDADDVIQTCLLKAWSRLYTYRAEASFRTWLTQVAINEVRQHRRSSVRLQLFWDPTDPQTLPSRDEAQDEALMRTEARDRLLCKVAELPAKYRDVVVLCDLQEAKLKDVARDLHSGVSMVKSRLFRARHMLRESHRKAA